MTIAIIDLDRFKQINDDFSHEIGDDVLRRIAAMLSELECDTGTGFAARLGGEEFVIVDRWCPPEDTRVRVESVRAAVETFDWSTIADGLRVTISAGVATAGPDDTQRSLLSRADRNLYAAKTAGRNRVVADT